MFILAQMSADQFDVYQLTEVRSFFVEDGVSIAQWARIHNFSLPLVYAVLKGRNQATRGESHKIAVALRLKLPKNRLALMGYRQSAESDSVERQN